MAPATAQNVFPNGSFDSGIAGWVAEGTAASVGWLPPPDALGNDASGALRFSVPIRTGSASSCTTASFPADWPVHVVAQVRSKGGLWLFEASLEAPGSPPVSDVVAHGTVLGPEEGVYQERSTRLVTNAAGDTTVCAALRCSDSCGVDLDEIVVEGALFVGSFE